MVQWLELCAYTARGMGSIPGQGAKILHALHGAAKEKIKKIYILLLQKLEVIYLNMDIIFYK